MPCANLQGGQYGQLFVAQQQAEGNIYIYITNPFNSHRSESSRFSDLLTFVPFDLAHFLRAPLSLQLG